MFTGLVEELATVLELTRNGDSGAGRSLHLALKAPLVGKDAQVGDSIAVNGCCLTVVNRAKNLLAFDAGDETLRRTNLERLKEGSRVNLERSLRVGDRLGGHLVTGHIDGLGTLLKLRREGEWAHLVFRVPQRLALQMASKGSVAVDGVSLTLVNVDAERFSVALIPHTLEHTTLGALQVGDAANIETDLLAKYVERRLESRGTPEEPGLPAFA